MVDLLDLMLPGLNGEDILPRIKGIPVIVLSAKVDIDNKVDLLLGGAGDYVTKPFHAKELFRYSVVFSGETYLIDFTRWRPPENPQVWVWGLSGR